MNRKFANKYFFKARGQSTPELALGGVLLIIAIVCIAAVFGTPKTGVPDGTKDLFAEIEMAIQRAGGDTSANSRVTVSDHGIKKHVEAKDLEESCNNNGPYQTWKDKYEKGKFYFICKVGDSYGIIPIVTTATGLIGKTAFSPGGGTLNEVITYLAPNATRFNGVVR